MGEINNSTINYQAFNLHDGEALIEQVARVICVLLPRGIIAAGFSEHGDLLMIRYGEYSNALPAWILDFYEHRFIDEHLLHDPDKVIATFVASDKYLVVPEDFYDEGAAVKWLQKIFFVEANELLASHRMQEDKARYLYAWPGTIKSLIGRYFTASKTLPLSSYQFYKPFKTESSLQCCITPEHVFATLYKNRALHWHQVFHYESGEDIAYQIKLLCKQQKLNPDTLDIHYTIAYRGLNNVLHEMAQFFPNMRDVEGGSSAGRQWAHTISLLQQLYACAL